MKSISDIGAEMLAAKAEPMDKGTTEFFVRLMFADDESLEDLSNNFIYKVLDGRIKYYKCSADARTKIFITYISDRAGVAVLYAAAIKKIYEISNNREVSFEHLSLMFPFGFPIEEEIHRIWNGQKDEDGSNMVDRES